MRIQLRSIDHSAQGEPMNQFHRVLKRI